MELKLDFTGTGALTPTGFNRTFMELKPVDDGTICGSGTF